MVTGMVLLVATVTQSHVTCSSRLLQLEPPEAGYPAVVLWQMGADLDKVLGQVFVRDRLLMMQLKWVVQQLQLCLSELACICSLLHCTALWSRPLSLHIWFPDVIYMPSMHHMVHIICCIYESIYFFVHMHVQ